MITLQSINTEIIGSNFSDADLNSIQDAIKFRRAQLVRKNICTLAKGKLVKFTASRSGMVECGKVVKINRKFVIIDTGSMKWRVPANMLSDA